ncbi:helix-turn-helix domain-containing protein [Clostridium hydrogeniformans]|uniref:helix-turn-helix domain-containing protein n=1 Tax=Clostridium hydrogeniformans TaxID=349933 RepID=UPI0005592C06|nr:helix-turn-helix transcriptional regulator [Clostridium hydrogeniformans]
MEEKLSWKIGKEIKEARKKMNLTQKNLAKDIDISRNYLSDIECGRYIPSVEKLLALSNKLNIDLNLFKNDVNTR